MAPRGAVLAACLAIGALGGLSLGWTLWGRQAPIVEAPAPEVRQPDGSLVLERAPDPGARAPMPLPRGSTLERVATVTVRPDPAPAPAPIVPDSGLNVPRETPAPPPCECAPVHVDLALVRLEDGSRRVIASARGGQVIGGVDVPVETPGPRRVLRWAAGAAWDPAAQRWGGFLDRDIDRVAFLPVPVRLGASVTPAPQGGLVYGIRVGLRF